MCAKLTVQSRIKEVVYFEKGEIDIRHDKGKKYVASRRILAAALPPKYTTYACINIQTHNFYREEDLIEETAREVIELIVNGINSREMIDLITEINNTVDPTAGGTDIPVKRPFQRILDAARLPKYTTYKHINI